MLDTIVRTMGIGQDCVRINLTDLWGEGLEDSMWGGLGLELGLTTELAVVLLQLK